MIGFVARLRKVLLGKELIKKMGKELGKELTGIVIVNYNLYNIFYIFYMCESPEIESG
tara:strand:- start:1659 stop:1832 length:174 start_codon:yes stop_codon:yes gene_type:complete